MQGGWNQTEMKKRERSAKNRVRSVESWIFSVCQTEEGKGGGLGGRYTLC